MGRTSIAFFPYIYYYIIDKLNSSLARENSELESRGEIHIAATSVPQILFCYRSLEPVPVHVKQLFVDGRLDAVSEHESIISVRVDRRTLVRDHAILDGEKKVAVEGGPV